MSIDKSMRQSKRSADFSQRVNQHKSVQNKRFVIDTNNSQENSLTRLLPGQSSSNVLSSVSQNNTTTNN